MRRAAAISARFKLNITSSGVVGLCGEVEFAASYFNAIGCVAAREFFDGACCALNIQIGIQRAAGLFVFAVCAKVQRAALG